MRKNKKNPQGLKCWLFRENHRSKDCKVFLKKSVKHRIQYIKEQKHIVKECKSNFSCSKDSCKKNITLYRGRSRAAATSNGVLCDNS